LAVAVVFCAAHSYAATWYVDKKATGSGTGTTWANAFTTLQAGINAATSGDQVWVGSGTYNEQRTSATDGALVLKAGVAVYGGFQGNVAVTGFETLLSQRDWFANVCTIDGSNGRGPSTAAYHVVDGASGATLDGFTVQGGNANGSTNPTDKRGGGIAIVGFTMAVSNCVIQNNVADNVAGGIICVSSASTFDRCFFKSNTAKSLSNPPGSGGGGAMCIDTATGNASITNCVFYGNTVTNANAVSGVGGGAVMVAGAISPAFQNCSFGGNTGWPVTSTPSPGTGSAGGGSAVYVLMGATPTFQNCIFWGDTNGGTEIANDTVAGPGANAAENAALPTLTSCIVQGTYAGPGTGNTATDPLYNALASGDLRILNSGSPAVNTGATNSLTKDYLGTTRPLTTVDRGAYEQDLTAPTCSGLNQLVNLNAAGSATLSAATVFSGSTDAGGIRFTYIKKSTGSTYASSVGLTCTDVGSVTVNGQITDYAGNVSTCNATITVQDVTAPALVSCAPATTNVNVNSGTCQATVPDLTGSATFTDACGVTKTQTPAAGSLFSGTQTVTITAKDPSNNSAQCTAQIVAQDNIPPVITLCPGAQALTADANCKGTVPNLLKVCPYAAIMWFSYEQMQKLFISMNAKKN